MGTCGPTGGARFHRQQTDRWVGSGDQDLKSDQPEETAFDSRSHLTCVGGAQLQLTFVQVKIRDLL